MKRRILIGLICLLAAGSLLADPAVSLSRVAQRYPWNGLVDIDYMVSDVGDPDFYSLALSLTAGGTKYDLTTFQGGAPAVSNGTYHVVWNAAADGVTAVSKEAIFAIDLMYHPIASDGDYMIVDVSGGTNAAIWQVTYMSDVADPAATFNTDEYKTTKLVFKKVKAGSFWMGSTPDKTSSYYDDMASFSGFNNEGPRHYVQLTKDYYLMLFQLTSRQYELMTGAMTPYNRQYYSTKPKLTAGGISKDMVNAETSPILALNFRARCAGLARARFDLPTEAQWEYACRAGTTTRYYFGDDPAALADHAWYTDKTTPPSWGHNVQEPGLLLPNPWGFYDMYGNQGQLMKDESNTYAEGDETHPVVDPCYTKPGGNIIYRGTGPWGSAASNRSSARSYTTAASTSCCLRLAFTCE